MRRRYRHMLAAGWIGVAVLVCQVGCGDLDSGGADAGQTDECDPRETARERVGSLQNVAEGRVDVESDSGVYSGSIEAKAGGVDNAESSSFLYVDLDDGKKLALSDARAFDNQAWDVAIRRTEIRLNGADSGPDAWRLTELDRSWEDVSAPPGADADWERDDFVSDDCTVRTFGRDYLQTAFGQWYDYDFATHEVSVPENAVYVLDDADSETTVKFELLTYSDAQYGVRWTEL